jgi:hypothetical protein
MSESVYDPNKMYVPIVLEGDKDKKIDSLTRRISELEEENRLIKKRVCFDERT